MGRRRRRYRRWRWSGTRCLRLRCRRGLGPSCGTCGALEGLVLWTALPSGSHPAGRKVTWRPRPPLGKWFSGASLRLVCRPPVWWGPGWPRCQREETGACTRGRKGSAHTPGHLVGSFSDRTWNKDNRWVHKIFVESIRPKAYQIIRRGMLEGAAAIQLLQVWRQGSAWSNAVFHWYHRTPNHLQPRRSTRFTRVEDGMRVSLWTFTLLPGLSGSLVDKVCQYIGNFLSCWSTSGWLHTGCSVRDTRLYL